MAPLVRHEGAAMRSSAVVGVAGVGVIGDVADAGELGNALHQGFLHPSFSVRSTAAQP